MIYNSFNGNEGRAGGSEDNREGQQIGECGSGSDSSRFVNINGQEEMTQNGPYVGYITIPIVWAQLGFLQDRGSTYNWLPATQTNRFEYTGLESYRQEQVLPSPSRSGFNSHEICGGFYSAQNDFSGSAQNGLLEGGRGAFKCFLAGWTERLDNVEQGSYRPGNGEKFDNERRQDERVSDNQGGEQYGVCENGRDELRLQFRGGKRGSSQLGPFPVESGEVDAIQKDSAQGFNSRQDRLHHSYPGQTAGIPTCPFDFVLVLDFETTCGENNNLDWPFEVIQFSCVVVDVKNCKIVDGVYFNSYVRPLLNSVLTQSCLQITGISQEVINSAATFKEVYTHFLEWLQMNKFSAPKFAIACDCRQDMWRIAQYQFRLSKLTMPAFFREYINVFAAHSKTHMIVETKETKKVRIIERLLKFYGVDDFQKAHNAYNDCIKLSRIIQKMLQQGVTLTINEVLVCQAAWRRTPLNVNPSWRSNFGEACKVYARVMPLDVQNIQLGTYSFHNYGKCKACGLEVKYCNYRHKQFPTLLYSLDKNIVFAKSAGFDKEF